MTHTPSHIHTTPLSVLTLWHRQGKAGRSCQRLGYLAHLDKMWWADDKTWYLTSWGPAGGKEKLITFLREWCHIPHLAIKWKKWVLTYKCYFSPDLWVRCCQGSFVSWVNVRHVVAQWVMFGYVGAFSMMQFSLHISQLCGKSSFKIKRWNYPCLQFALWPTHKQTWECKC